MADILTYKKLMDIENLNEDVHHTKEGISVVSPIDTFWSRLGKEGEMVSGYAQNGVINDTLYGPVLLVPGLGRRLYVSRIYASSTIPARATVTIEKMNHGRMHTPSVPIVTNYYETFYLAPYQPLVLTYNGELWMKEKSQLRVTFQALNTGEIGKFDTSVMGWEVAVNA